MACAMKCTGGLASQAQMCTHHNGGKDEGELVGGDETEAVHCHQGEGLGEEALSSDVYYHIPHTCETHLC